jgi:hypothetical protein
VVNLDSYVKAIWDEPSLQITLVKLGQKIILQIPRKADFFKWKEHLRTKCLVTDFHLEYKVKKRIK